MDLAEIGMLCLSLIVGFAVGTLFYLGLWWTIVRRSGAPLWWWMSFIVRITAAGAIFYLIANVHVARYILMLLGFVLSRKMIVKMKTTG